MGAVYQGVCARCGEPVRGHCARELSSAWEVQRVQGGANAVHGPKVYSGRVMHRTCHEGLQRRGVGLQTALM